MATVRPTRRPTLPSTLRASRRRWAARLLVLAAALAAVYALSGSIGELQAAIDALGSVRPGWIAVAVVLEAGYYLAYACSELRLLRVGGSGIGLLPVTGQTVASLALANCLPAGAALSTVYSYRLFRRFGVAEPLAAWVLALNSLLWVAVLTGLTLVGSEIAGGSGGGAVPDLRPVALAVLAVLVALTAAAVLLARRGVLARVGVRVAALAARAARRPDPSAVARAWIGQLVAYSMRPSDWASSAGWLVASWIADLGCLTAAFPAVGSPVPWRGLLLAYGAAQLASTLPITPGGLGIVEGSLTVALVAYGGASVTTLSAVLLYRVISYWGSLPAGALAWLALRRVRQEQLDPLPDEAAEVTV